jgi:hypothetical protein
VIGGNYISAGYADVKYWMGTVRDVCGRGDAEGKGERVFGGPPDACDRFSVEGIDEDAILKVEGLDGGETDGPTLRRVRILGIACLWAKYLFE